MKETHQKDLAKWLAGNMTPAELEAFGKTQGFLTYEKIAAASARLEAPELDDDKMLRNIVGRPKKKRKPLRLYNATYLRIAALLCVFAASYYMLRDTSVSVAAADGKRALATLPDRSEVRLNSGSELSYLPDIWDKKRTLQLKGEAFFKVTKGRKFTVKTALGTVAVVGTQFNVRERGSRFEVECFDGKVRVNHLNRDYILTKGMAVAFEKGKKIVIAPENTATPSWLRGELAFRSEYLPDLIAEIERRFAVKIDLPAKVSNKKFTGTLPGNQVEVALRLIGNTYGLRPIAKGNSQYALSAK